MHRRLPEAGRLCTARGAPPRALPAPASPSAPRLGGPFALLLLALAGAACTSAARPALLSVRFEPTGDVIYKIDDDLGRENWDFALIASGPASDIDRLRIRHRAHGKTVQKVELGAAAQAAYRAPASGRETVWRYLHFRLPAQLELDSVEVELLAGDQVRGRAVARLVRLAQTKRFRLPLEGCWFVSAGYDFGIEHRRHYSRGHFAWDFVRVDAQGRLASGEALADSYGFGQPVLAPADGRVVDVRDDFEDRPPGRPGESRRANYIVIDHGDGVHSRLMHLKRGSARVRAGDRVLAGEEIAAVGNSGSSDTPHLHLGFERETTDAEGRALQRPLPIRLSDYRVSWNQGTQIPVELGRPRRGQFVCAAPRRSIEHHAGGGTGEIDRKQRRARVPQ